MKILRISPITCFLVLFVLLATNALADQSMSVQVKRGQVRNSPSFMGKIILSLSYGDPVQVEGKKSSWSKIRVPGTGTQGWMHTSALTSKKLILTAGKADVQEAASNSEIALAGKGFNEEVEGQYKAKNSTMDYTWIDTMEGFVVSQAQINRFIKEGNLAPEGGAR